MDVISTYHVGEPYTLESQNRNAAGALADPTSVNFYYKKPDGSTAVAASGDIQHPSTGIYTLSLIFDQPGVWYFGVVATGNPQSYQSKIVYVIPRQDV